jgi:hypothetical protein
MPRQYGGLKLEQAKRLKDLHFFDVSGRTPIAGSFCGGVAAGSGNGSSMDHKTFIQLRK